MQDAMFGKSKRDRRYRYVADQRSLQGSTGGSLHSGSPSSSTGSTPIGRRKLSQTNNPLRALAALPDLLKLTGGHRGGSNSTGSLAASDGELEHTQDDTLLGKGGRGLDITGNIPQQKDIGRVSSWAVGFERLLQDTMGLDCFTQFLKVEFSEENIMFWIACEQMSKIHDKSKLEKHAHDIYEKYLSPKATHPVNLEGQCQEMVEAALKNPTPEIFRNQQQQIFKLMKFDSYSRFLKSKMYQDCVLAEMAGEPLPIYKKSPATDSSKLTAAEEKANKKKSWFGSPFRK